MEHLNEQLRILFIRLKLNEDDYLDGELCSDELTFQQLAGTLRRGSNSPSILNQIKYHVFDTFNTNKDLPFYLRWQSLTGTLEHKQDHIWNDLLHIEPVRTFEVKDKWDVAKFNMLYAMPNGYEGTIIRNTQGLYKTNHRSADLQKLKQFQDAEYEILDFKEGSGVEKGCVIWECGTIDKLHKFWVRPTGSHKERKELFNHGKEMVGKFLTVRFQELTDIGIPRFPVGINIRDYE